MASGQHALLEDLIARCAHAVLHHHVRRQIGAFAAEAVGHPRTHAREAGKLMAGVPDDFADRMDRRIGVHALEKSDLVHHRRQSWINLAHPRAALAVLFEIKHRRQDLAVLHRFFGIKTLQIIIAENLRGLFCRPIA